MANKAKPPSSERTRVRFMLVDFDGSSDDLQQLAHTFAQAVKIPQPILVAPAPPIPLNGHVAPGVHGKPLEQAEEAQETLIDPTEAEPAAVDTAERGNSKPSGGTKRKYKSPEVIADLEFTSGSMPLKQYMDEQAPEEHSKRYLAIAFWLKEYRSYQEIGADHVYSCYRALGLNVPDDVLSVFRGLKKRGWVVEGTEKGLFKINHIGEGQLKKVAA